MKLKKTIVPTICVLTVLSGGMYLNNYKESIDKYKIEVEKTNREFLEDMNTRYSELDKFKIQLDQQLKDIDEERNKLENEKELYKKERNRRLSVSYNADDISAVSNIRADELAMLLNNDNMRELTPYIVEAEQKYGVNAIFLTGLIANESGWNSSTRAKTQNNLTGYAVYSRGASGKSFSSKRESIMVTADLIKNKYLTSTGEHYNGKSIYDVNKKYCQDNGKANYSWANTINSISYKISEDYAKKIR